EQPGALMRWCEVTDGASVKSNPFSADDQGQASLFAAGGAYRITARSGSFERVWRYVGIGTAQELDAGQFLTGGDWQAVVATPANLPSSPSVGDRVLVLDAGDGRAAIYERAASNWIGPIYITGATGPDGREVELRKSATHLQWRYAGDTAWIDIVPLAEITGPQGATGTKGDPGNIQSVNGKS